MQKMNFTMIPNEVIDEHLKDLTGAEIKILLAITRKTIGWHKETDWICNQQMMDITGLSKKTVIMTVKSLIDKKLIVQETIGKPGKEKLCYELDFEGGKKVTGGGVKSTPEGCNNVTHNINTTKETIQKKKDLPAATIPIMKVEKEYFELFKSEFGEDADYNFPGGRKLINKYLRTHTEEKIIDLIRIWFYCEIGAWHGYSFMCLQKDWNRLLIIYNNLQMYMLTREIYTKWASNIRALNERDNKTFEVPDYDGWRKKEIKRRFEEQSVYA